MFSVLIQNQKTIEIFQEFHPLFMEAMNKEKIGICRWMEPGTTVDTALPELKELIEDKEEWRAIIVRLVDEDSMREYKYDQNNPYDFEYYHREENVYQESPIPLVRLTNMLGELPPPEIRYEAVTIQEENKSPKIIYQPRKVEEEEQLFRELLEKYDYDGKRPTEIILVTLRVPRNNVRAYTEEIWRSHTEIQSSDFWKKNFYSPACRFIVYDMKQEGSVQYEADLFKFWNGVLLLALNRIDTDELQAFRLYKMNIQLDKKGLQAGIQNCINRLYGARHFMKQLLQAEDSKWMKERRQLPDYKMEVPVLLELPRRNDMSVSSGLFPLVTNSVEEDLKRFGEMKKTAEFALRDTANQAAIALDEAAERMRGMCSVEESEVKQLNKYQRKMMDADLHNLYTMVLHLQKELPDSKNVINEKVKKSAEEARTSLMARVTAGQIMGTGMLIVFLILSVFLPGLLTGAGIYSGKAVGIVTIILLLIDIMVIPVLCKVIVQKQDITEKIKTYNHMLHTSMMKIAENSGVYSDFLSSIVSHSRGKSYQQILNYKKFTLSSTQTAVEKHLKAIDSMMFLLEKWNKAFYLNANFDQSFYEDDMFELSVLPIKNRLYTFEYGRSYHVPLNNSGQMLKSNVEFVTKLELIREELYK